MHGRRLPDGSRVSEPGDYWLHADGNWHCQTPNGLQGNLGNHDIVVHEDGTITADPSILVTWPHAVHPQRYHGYLRQGVWETLPDTDPMPDA